MDKHPTFSPTRTIFIALLALLILSACIAPAAVVTPAPSETAAAPTQPQPAASATATAAATAAATATPNAATATKATTATAPTPASAVATATAPTDASGAWACDVPHPAVTDLLAQAQPESWMRWIRQLSGAEPVTIAGETVTIETRFTPAMFNADFEPQPNARAFAYLEETVRGWYPEEQIAVQSFSVTTRDGETLYGRNLILTLPGESLPDEVVLLTAHFDSTSNPSPMQRAPGAEDNGSGSAALFEAARLLRGARFERTIRIIWFTGEELGLLGSRAYVESELFDPRAVKGVVNLDMFGHDTDDDRCFEMHVGTLPASDRVGQCFVASAQAYALGLETYDYLTDEAVNASDHGTFWREGVGAIEILENMFDNQQPSGCANKDPNPAYHTEDDTHDRLNPETGIRITRAAIATVAGMAGPR